MHGPLGVCRCRANQLEHTEHTEHTYSTSEYIHPTGCVLKSCHLITLQ